MSVVNELFFQYFHTLKFRYFCSRSWYVLHMYICMYIYLSLSLDQTPDHSWCLCALVLELSLRRKEDILFIPTIRLSIGVLRIQSEKKSCIG